MNIIELVDDLNDEFVEMGLDNEFQFYNISNGFTNIIKLEGGNSLNFSMTLYSDDMVFDISIKELYVESKISYIEMVREQIWRSFEDIVYNLNKLTERRM